MHKPRSGGLWWFALLILVTGGGIAYLFSLQEANPSADQWLRLTISLTAIGVGVCVIASTADWWLCC